MANNNKLEKPTKPLRIQGRIFTSLCLATRGLQRRSGFTIRSKLLLNQSLAFVERNDHLVWFHFHHLSIRPTFHLSNSVLAQLENTLLPVVQVGSEGNHVRLGLITVALSTLLQQSTLGHIVHRTQRIAGRTDITARE